MSPSLIVQQWLISQMLATDPLESSPVWPCYMVALPEGMAVPSNALCVYDTSPVPDGRIQSTGERINHPGIQIKCRCLDYQTGWTKIHSIASALDAILRAQVSVDSEIYTISAATRISGPLSLGIDPSSPKQAFAFTLNYQLTF